MLNLKHPESLVYASSFYIKWLTIEIYWFER